MTMKIFLNDDLSTIAKNSSFSTGSQYYLVREEIKGETSAIWIQRRIPKTNQGIECIDGSLGSNL